MSKVQEALNEAFEALLPFADCLQYIEIDEDDEEWAKFRLLIKHYRQAAVAYEKCKSALAEIENCEPVAYMYESAQEVSEGLGRNIYGGFKRTLSFTKPKDHPQFRNVAPVYTSPISKEFVRLKISNEELLQYAVSEELLLFASEDDFLAIANGVLELVNIKLNAEKG